MVLLKRGRKCRGCPFCRTSVSLRWSWTSGRTNYPASSCPCGFGTMALRPGSVRAEFLTHRCLLVRVDNGARVACSAAFCGPGAARPAKLRLDRLHAPLSPIGPRGCRISAPTSPKQELKSYSSLVDRFSHTASQIFFENAICHKFL